MTPENLLRWLIAHGKQRMAVPIDEIEPDWVEALVVLQDRGKVHLSEHEGSTLIWIDPSVFRRRGQARCDRPEILETDLPPDVAYLKHAPDRDSMPVSGMRLNGEPVYRPRDEPSSLILCGSQPWPPEGTEIKPRWYRPARAKWTTEERRDLVVTADTCPVCGRAESKKIDPRCLACDCWPSSYPTTVRTLEVEPDDQPKPSKAKKKGAKAS